LSVVRCQVEVSASG